MSLNQKEDKMLILKRMLFIFAVLTLIIASSSLVAAMDDEKPNQTKCPVMGSKINKEVYTDYNGKRVYFCCAGCDKKFLEEPDKYLEKMKKEGVVLEDAPITQTQCPVSGEDINKEIYSDHNGERVYFCCNGCKKAFDENPEKYLKKE